MDRLDLQHVRFSPDAPEIVVGKSPAQFLDASQNKPARKVREMIDRCTGLDIMHPGTKVSEGPRSALLHTMNGMVFVNTQVPETGKWYLHARVLSSDRKGNYVYTDASRIPAVGRLHVITGMCLFSAPAVQAVDTEGHTFALTNPYVNTEAQHPISEIKVDHRLQPYEADSIMRLTRFISSLKSSQGVEVMLAIPRIEYWNYALDLYEKGLIDKDLLLEWFKTVNQRAERITDLITSRITATVTVRPISPLESVETRIIEAVQANERVIAPELVDRLVQGNETWAKIFQANQSQSSDEPSDDNQSFADLSYLGYSVGYLEALNSSNGVLFAVENPEEVRILDQTKRFIHTVRSGATIVALYPHTNIILTEKADTGDRRFLYFYNPNGTHRQAIRQAVASNKHQ